MAGGVPLVLPYGNFQREPLRWFTGRVSSRPHCVCDEGSVLFPILARFSFTYCTCLHTEPGVHIREFDCGASISTACSVFTRMVNLSFTLYTYGSVLHYPAGFLRLKSGPHVTCPSLFWFYSSTLFDSTLLSLNIITATSSSSPPQSNTM